jgi:hypothetical protein
VTLRTVWRSLARGQARAADDAHDLGRAEQVEMELEVLAGVMWLRWKSEYFPRPRPDIHLVGGDDARAALSASFVVSPLAVGAP